MQVLCLVWGILSLIGFLVALFPCLGSLNWLNIPFSGIGLIISIIATVTGQPGNKGMSVVGIVLCAIAIVIGLIRLILGGGIA